MSPPDRGGTGHSAQAAPDMGAELNRFHVLVLAKAPVAGAVKTRLCPPCSPAEAAAVAAAALADTLDAVAACGAGRRIVALWGEPGPWLPPGVAVVAQRGRTLGERLACAWADADGPGLQIGSDTPQVTAGDLDDALALLGGAPAGGRERAVLGPATDGGWWAIGLPQCDPGAVFAGIPMSSSRTGACQHRRLLALGFDVRLAASRRDIDTVDDLVAVAHDAPGTRTAAVAETLGLTDRAFGTGLR